MKTKYLILATIALILLAGNALAATATITGNPGNWQNSDATAIVNIDGNPCPGGMTCKIQAFNDTSQACSTNFADYTLSDSHTVSSHQWICAADDNGDYSTSATEFKIDKTVPTTTDDFGAKNDVWQTTEQTITLTPADTGGSGILETKYCTDTVNTCDPLAGTAYTAAVTIATENTTYFRYASKDNAGNIQTTVSKIVKINKIPTITDNYGAKNNVWQNSAQTVTLTPVDTYTGIKEVKYCTGAGCTPTTVIAAPYTLPYSTEQNTVLRYMATDNENNNSAIGETTIKIDLTAPTATLTSNTGTNWTNSQNPSFTISATDASSGASTMKFSCNNSSWSSEIAVVGTYSSFSITGGTGCTSTSEAKTIYLQIKDTAGNWSSSSSATVNYDASAPNTPSAPSVTAGNGQVNVSWSSVSDNGPSGIQNYRVYVNGSVNTTTTNTSATITGLTNGTAYSFKIGALDNAGNEAISSEVSTTPSSTIQNNVVQNNPAQNDTTNPVVSWISPADGSTVSGIVMLEVTANDAGTGINFVTFELPDKNYVTATSPETGTIYNGTWEIAWSTIGLDKNKTYTIRVFAKDKGNPINNSSTSMYRTFKIDNTAAVLDTAKKDSGEAISMAEQKKSDLENLMEGLGEQGASLGGTQKQEADDLLAKAQDSYAKKEYSNAKEYADDAYKKYYELMSAFSVDSYGNEQEYLFSEGKLSVLLKSLGFDDQAIEEATSLLSQFPVARKLAITRIKGPEGEYYKAIIKIIVENNSDSDKELKILEIIPKEFAESSDLLSSSENMIVIEKDPRIEFSTTVPAGETKTIEYSLNKQMTQEEADNLLASNPLDFFAVPPVPLETTTAAPAVSQATGLFSLNLLDNAGIIGIVIGIIVIVAIAGFLVYRFGSSEPKNSSPLSNFGNMGSFERFNSSARSRGIPKAEPRKAKWRYEWD